MYVSKTVGVSLNKAEALVTVKTYDKLRNERLFIVVEETGQKIPIVLIPEPWAERHNVLYVFVDREYIGAYELQDG